jgi:serine/threonine protein kinase
MQQPQPSQLKLDSVDLSALGDMYVMDRILGEGTFGIVLRARHKQTGAWYAIKKLRLDGHTEGVPATAIREITLLQELSSHPNIVKLLQVVCRKHRVYLVFELMTEDLRSYLSRARKALPPNHAGTVLPVPMVKQLTRQILDALWSCHHNRILHRDLKPGNLLLQDAGNGQLVIKLADFGLARTFELPLVTYTNEVVTMWYRSPEILLGEKHYTPSVDIWSVGCILVEMLTGRALFQGESQLDQVYKIFGLLGTPTEETWPGVTALSSYSNSFPLWRPQDLGPMLPAVVQQTGGVELILAMLQLNPKQRPTAGELLKHPWLQLEG